MPHDLLAVHKESGQVRSAFGSRGKRAQHPGGYLGNDVVPPLTPSKNPGTDEEAGQE
ncbi:MAG: hypothetical protein V3U28_06055 [Candidatus Acidoferrales bacterium]